MRVLSNFFKWKQICFGHVIFMADWKFQNSQTSNGYSVTWIWKIFKQSIKLQRTCLLFSSIGKFLLVTWWPKKWVTWIYSHELWSMIIKLLWKTCECCCVHPIYYPCGPSKPLFKLLYNSKNPFTQTISELLWINKHSWTAVMSLYF